MKGVLPLVIAFFLVIALVGCDNPVYVTEFVTGFQTQLAPYAGFDGIVDTYLSTDQPTADHSTTVVYCGYSGSAISRGLFRFDIFGLIPSDVTVTKAVFTSRLNGGAFGNVTFSAHEMSEGWSAANASWNYISTSTSTAWSAGAGGSFEAASIGTTFSSNGNNSISIELAPSVVQKWLLDYTDNLGFMIKAADETIPGWILITPSDSTLYAYSPRLTVYYTK